MKKLLLIASHILVYGHISAQTFVGTVTSQSVNVSYTPNGANGYSSCGQDVELLFSINGTPLQAPNYTYPLYPYLKLRLNPDFKANWNYAYGNSQVQYLQTGNENGQDYVVLKVNYFSAGTSTAPLIVHANYRNCGDGNNVPTVTLTSIADVFVLSTTNPGSAITNPANFTSSCTSLIINKQPFVNFTLPLPVDITDGVKGGVYTRSYNFKVLDPKATNHNGYLNFRSSYDPAINRVALRALVTNAVTLSTTTVNLTNLTITASGTAFTNTFLRLTDVPNQSTIIFQEDVQIVSCMSSAASSSVFIDNYCTGTTPSDFCSDVAWFSPKISDGGKTTKVDMVKQTIVRDGGQTVYNFDAALGINTYTQTAVGMCFSQSTGYTNTMTFRNTSEGTLAANNLSLRINNGSSTFVPFELMSMTILGANGSVTGTYTSSSLGYVPIPELATSGYQFSGRPITCLTTTSLREVDQVWVNALTVSGMTASVPSFITLQKGEQLILSIRDYICCASMSVPGVYYDFTHVDFYSKGECSPTYAYNGGSTYQTIASYNARESSANTFASKMAGGSVAGFNGDQQQISVRLLNIDAGYSRLYDINDANFVFTVRTQHGLTSDLTNPSNNPFTWSGLPQHPATLTLQLNNSSVFYILTLSGYNQDNNATSIAGLAPTFTNDVPPAPVRSAHEFIYKIPFKTLYNLASTLSGGQFGNDVVQNIQALLNGAVITTNLKAYCTFLPNSYFNVEMGFEPKSTCPTGACANLMGRYAGRILVNCPGCAIPGAIVKSVSTGRTPSYLGYTDANNDRIADNLSTCTSCHMDWARQGDVLETLIGVSFSDGDVSKGGFIHSDLLNSTSSILGLDETMTQILNFGNQSVTKVEVSTALGAAWVTVPDSYIYSNNGSVAKTPGVPLPISNDLVVRVPSTLLGMNKRFFNFTSSSGSNDFFNLKVTHQITGTPSNAPDNVQFNIFTYASDIPVFPTSSTTSDVCAGTCKPLASLTPGLQYWCERNAGMYRFIPYNSLGGFSSPGIGGNATGTYCSPTLSSGVSSFPSSSDYPVFVWMPGFENEYRGLETATAFQVFVPSSVQLDYFTVSNTIRLTTTATGDLVYYQKLAVFTNSGLCTSTAQPGGRMYTLTFPYALVTPTVASSIIANSNVLTTATGTTKLYLSDDAFNIQVGTVLRFKSCLANTTSSFLTLGDGFARFYYPSPTQFGYPNGALALNTVLAYPLADMTISGLSDQNLTIYDRTFSFPIRVNPLEPKQADGSSYTQYQPQFGTIGKRPVENAFIAFSNLPSTLTILGIVTPTGTITSDVNGIFRLGTLDPGLSIPNGDYTVVAQYLCDDACQPTETVQCLNGYNIKLNYGWNCQQYPTNASTTALSGFCSVKSIDYYLTTSFVKYGATAALSVNGIALSNGATRDFCEPGLTVGYLITEQATGRHNRFSFETLLPPGYSFNPLATVTFNGVTITTTSTLIANTTGTGNWLRFPNLSVPNPANPNTPFTGVNNNNQPPIFPFNFPVTFQCAKLPGTNTFKFRVLAENYCGKINVVEPDPINLNSTVSGFIANGYTLTLTTNPVLACPTSSSMNVTVKITKTGATAQPGTDAIRLSFPSELACTSGPSGWSVIGGQASVPVLYSDLTVGGSRFYTFALTRTVPSVFCSVRSLTVDMVSYRTLTCSGLAVSTCGNVGVLIPNTSTTVGLVIQNCPSIVPTITGVSALCAYNGSTYNVTNVGSFPSGTQFLWSVGSYANNSNLTLSTTLGNSVLVNFGYKPGVDTLIVRANMPNGCNNPPVKKVVKTYANWGNVLTMTNPKGFSGSYCAGQIFSLSSPSTIPGIGSRVGITNATSTSFVWNLAIRTVTGSTSSQIVTFTAPGIYNVSYTASNSFGCSQTVKNSIYVFPSVCGTCLALNDSSRIENVPALISTDIDASTFPNDRVVFDGLFGVNNNVTFRNGVFVLKPGSLMIMDGPVNSATDAFSLSTSPGYVGPQITLDNATLLLNSATMAGCSTMWMGITLQNNSGLNTTGTSTNYSKIQDSFQIYANPGTKLINISNTVFENNFWSLNLFETSAKIQNSIFTSSPPLFKYPYRQGIDVVFWVGPNNGVAYSSGTTFAHIELNEVAKGYQNRIRMDNCIIEKSLVGFRTQQTRTTYPNEAMFSPYYAFLDTITPHSITNSTFRGNAQNITNYFGKYYLANNTIQTLNNSNWFAQVFSPNNNLAPDIPSIFNSGRVTAINNTLTMDAPQDGLPSLDKAAIHNIASRGHMYLRNNTFQGFSKGVFVYLWTDPQDGMSSYPALYDTLVGNNFSNNTNGVLYTINQVYGLPLTAYNRCNTYNATGISTAQGVNLNTYSNSLTFGSDQAPSGNSFVGYTSGSNNYSILNNGPVTNYWTGTDENLVQFNNAGSGSVQLNLSGNPSSCSGHGFSNGVGRLAEPSENVWSLTEVQDSLQSKVGSKAKQKNYQAFVINKYVSNKDFDGLRQYMAALKNCNREAYYTICFYLMARFDQLGDTAKVRACKVAALDPNPKDKEVVNRILYFDFEHRPLKTIPSKGMQRFYSPLGQLTPKDSAFLAKIATSGTSVAASAKEKLKRYYPWFECDTRITYDPSIYDTVQCDSKYAFARKEMANDAKTNILGDAYPNPSTVSTRIPYDIVTDFEVAYIELLNLVSGQRVLTYQIDKKLAKGFWEINTSAYTSGIYGYRLMVDGSRVNIKKLIIIE